MKRKYNVLMLVAALVALCVVPVLSVAAQDSLIESVCLVTDLGKVNDGTFNQFAHEGAERATDDFGLEYNYIETQAQTDYETNIQTCLDEGYDTIVTVGFLIAEATSAAAAANPETYFIGVDQFQVDGPTNYVGIQFREDQGGFLAGAIAAQMSASGTVAGVYGIDIPPVVKFRNGFEQGALYVNPDINLLGVYIDSFTAPDRGAAAAAQFLGEGADVVFGAGGPTGSGGIIEAAGQGALVIGVDQDEYVTTFGNGETPGADRIVSSAVKRVDNGVYQMIEALVNGGESFVGGGIYILSVNNDGIGFAPAHDADVPEEVTAMTEGILEGLKAGTIVTGVDPVSGALLPTTVEALTEAGNFTMLLAALEAAGIAEIPAGSTVFAPTDEALAALPEGTLETVMADPAALTDLLLYHVVPGAVSSADVVAMGGGEVVAANGGTIVVTVSDSGVTLNDSVNVTTADIFTREGVVHVIDGVLMPAE